MKRLGLALGIVTTFGLAMAGNTRLSPLPTAQAEEGCSEKTLRGDYLMSARSDRAPNDTAVNYPRVFAGVVIFDGKGRFSSMVTRSLGGQIQREVLNDGSYTLDSNCVGTQTFEGGTSHWDLFASRDGDEVQAIQTDEGRITTRTYKKR